MVDLSNDSATPSESKKKNDRKKIQKLQKRDQCTALKALKKKNATRTIVKEDETTNEAPNSNASVADQEPTKRKHDRSKTAVSSNPKKKKKKLNTGCSKVIDTPIEETPYPNKVQVETVLDLEESELQVHAVKSLEEKAEAEVAREPSDPFIQVEPKGANLTELAEQLPSSKAKKLGRAKLTTMEEISAFTTKRKIEEGLSEFPHKVDGITQLLLLGDDKVA